MSWFTVPGQNCPVALGSYGCEYDADCEAHLQALAKENPACAQLVGPDTGLGWTNAGAIQNSSTGSLRCNGIRKVCEMKENFKNTDQDKMANTYTWIAIILGAIGALLFLIYKVMEKRGRFKILGSIGKILIGLGIFSLAFAVLDLSD